MHTAKSITMIGSEYGGWDVCLGLIPAGATIISAGIGNDISFDRFLIEKRGCFIIMVDPNQVAIDMLSQCDLPKESYAYITAALWINEGPVEFSAEYSNGAGMFNGGRTLKIGAVTLDTLLSDYPDTALLKMDIEGAEFEVLGSYNFTNRPAQVAVGFHTQKRPALSLPDSVARMERIGYRIAHRRVEGESEIVILFVRGDL